MHDIKEVEQALCTMPFVPLLLIYAYPQHFCADKGYDSRGDEAKALGIKMGMPHFMIEDLIRQIGLPQHCQSKHPGLSVRFPKVLFVASIEGCKTLWWQCFPGLLLWQMPDAA